MPHTALPQEAGKSLRYRVTTEPAGQSYTKTQGLNCMILHNAVTTESPATHPGGGTIR